MKHFSRDLKITRVKYKFAATALLSFCTVQSFSRFTFRLYGQYPLNKVIDSNCASSPYQVRGDVVAFSIKINSGNERALWFCKYSCSLMFSCLCQSLDVN